MTDPLIEIAEEMEDRGGQARAWAMRIRAFWTPQRKAFYEAAMDFFESRHADDEMDTINERLILADKAYRALVESERGESEGK